MKISFKQEQEKESSYRESVLKEMAKHGALGLTTEAFIRQHNVGLKFRKQKNSGASWTLNGNIHLNAQSYSLSTNPNNPGMLSLLVHEVHHLRQGIITALSVYGELDAWQVGFNFYQRITGSQVSSVLHEILELPLCFSRDVLREAARLMTIYSPGYRIDLLPLYPIHQEIAWRVTRKEPGKVI